MARTHRRPALGLAVRPVSQPATGMLSRKGRRHFAPPAAVQPARRWVEGAMRAGLLSLSRSAVLRRATAEFGPARRAARRFVAGEARTDAIAAVTALRRDGLSATVAFLGEHVTEPRAARTAAAEVAGLLRDLSAAGLEPNCSVKLTQLGLGFDAALAEEGLRAVLAVAREVDGFLRIDMEGSDVLPATLELFERVTAGDGAVRHTGLVIQSYLRRSEADVTRLVERSVAMRLVKGAYAEPPELAYQAKADVDAAYVRLADLLLDGSGRPAARPPAFATHDTAMIAAVLRAARQRGITPDGYEFQMLLGVRRDLQRRLVGAGQRVRVYVPYGDQWYPYMMRRLAERPANLLFVLRGAARA